MKAFNFSLQLVLPRDQAAPSRSGLEATASELLSSELQVHMRQIWSRAHVD